MTEFELTEQHYDMTPGTRLFLVKTLANDEMLMIVDNDPCSEAYRVVPRAKLKEVTHA